MWLQPPTPPSSSRPSLFICHPLRLRCCPFANTVSLPCCRLSMRPPCCCRCWHRPVAGLPPNRPTGCRDVLLSVEPRSRSCRDAQEGGHAHEARTVVAACSRAGGDEPQGDHPEVRSQRYVGCTTARPAAVCRCWITIVDRAGVSRHGRELHLRAQRNRGAVCVSEGAQERQHSCARDPAADGASHAHRYVLRPLS